MSLSRRQTLALLGGGCLVAATATTSAHVLRSPDLALQPWQEAGRYTDPRKRALSWAILAPNPHNRQPWIVDLSEPDAATLFVDTGRLLPHTDPMGRQIVIGLGCFLETLDLAAEADGHRLDIALFPEGSSPDRLDVRPVAHIRFATAPDAGPDPLFAQIPHRRSVKEPYDLTRLVTDAAIAALAAPLRHGTVFGATNAPDDVAALRALSEAALEIEIATPHTFKESVDLFRIGAREVNAAPDGIDFTGPMFESLRLAGLFSREAALDPASIAFRSGRDAVLENARTAMAHVWLNTHGNSRADQIAAGRDWMRLHLGATAQGLSVQPLSQALQEYPEMAGPYRDIHAALAPGGETVQMFARLGHAAPVPPSPRWPLESKLRNV